MTGLWRNKGPHPNSGQLCKTCRVNWSFSCDWTTAQLLQLPCPALFTLLYMLNEPKNPHQLDSCIQILILESGSRATCNGSLHGPRHVCIFEPVILYLYSTVIRYWLWSHNQDLWQPSPGTSCKYRDNDTYLLELSPGFDSKVFSA